MAHALLIPLPYQVGEVRNDDLRARNKGCATESIGSKRSREKGTSESIEGDAVALDRTTQSRSEGQGFRDDDARDGMGAIGLRLSNRGESLLLSMLDGWMCLSNAGNAHRFSRDFAVS